MTIYLIYFVILLIISVAPKISIAQHQQAAYMLTAINDSTFGWTVPFKATDTTAMLVPYLRGNVAAGTYGTITNLALKAPTASPTFTGTVSQANATLTSQKYYLSPITTTNATLVLIASIPIPINKSYDIEVYMMAVKGDGLTRNCGYIRGVFSRVAGNLAQDGTLKNDLLGVMSTTKVSFVLNNTTHEVELYANGLAATTINWNFFLEITNLL